VIGKLAFVHRLICEAADTCDAKQD
jgi:hypothetical protein